MRIVVEGLIGVGKSTLIQEAAEVLNLQPLFESVEDNPFLDKYYAHPERWAYTLQMHFLYDRYQKHLPDNIILDRSIYGDLCFAKIQKEEQYLSGEEYASYLRHFSILSSLVPPADVCIHLDITPEQAVSRIKKRGRGYESEIPISYLQMLHDQLTHLPTYLPSETRYLRVAWEDMEKGERREEIDKLFGELVCPKK